MDLPIRVGGYAPQGSALSFAVNHFVEVFTQTTGQRIEVMYNVMDTGRPATYQAIWRWTQPQLSATARSIKMEESR